MAVHDDNVVIKHYLLLFTYQYTYIYSEHHKLKDMAISGWIGCDPAIVSEYKNLGTGDDGRQPIVFIEISARYTCAVAVQSVSSAVYIRNRSIHILYTAYLCWRNVGVPLWQHPHH